MGNQTPGGGRADRLHLIIVASADPCRPGPATTSKSVNKQCKAKATQLHVLPRLILAIGQCKRGPLATADKKYKSNINTCI